MPRKKPPAEAPAASQPSKKHKPAAPAPAPVASLPKKKHAPAAAVVADWRAPLYFLHGEVATSDSATTSWHGTWVTSEGGELPSLQAFRESTARFNMTTGDFLSTGVPLEVRCPIGRSGSFGGGYTNSDGRAFYDHEHRLVVMDHLESCSLVAERGESNIGGCYISIGRLVFPRDGKGTALLTLARRYLTGDDPRAHMEPWELLFRMVGQVTRGCRERDDFAPQAPAPWKLLD